MSPALNIKHLSICFGTQPVVSDLSLTIEPGTTLGLVGESGSGKSSTALSVLRLLPPKASVSGQILWGQQDLLTLPIRNLNAYRGGEIAMIFQEPMTALNPVLRIGVQLDEAVSLHNTLKSTEIRSKGFYWLEKMGLTDLDRIRNAFPHELSGGQKQRILIAMAMAGNPKLLIADEPTTALDMSVQKGILDLLKSLQKSYGLSMLFISHDLGLVRAVADEVAVLQNGHLLEKSDTESLFKHPRHPYTKGLIQCRPSLEKRWKRLATIEDLEKNQGFELVEFEGNNAPFLPLLEVDPIDVYFEKRSAHWASPQTRLKALDAVKISVGEGECVGIVGESGSGKTTLARVISGLLEPDAGAVYWPGNNPRSVQMVFQDPFGSLNPRIPVGLTVQEPLALSQPDSTKPERVKQAIELFERVGLNSGQLQRLPHELSGGQRQRVAIARALAMQPILLICDEITSALDVSIQATILNLLKDIQEKTGLSLLFISHDLAVIRQMCDRIYVLKDGRVDCALSNKDLFEVAGAQTPYVQLLLDSVV